MTTPTPPDWLAAVAAALICLLLGAALWAR